MTRQLLKDLDARYRTGYDVLDSCKNNCAPVALFEVADRTADEVVRVAKRNGYDHTGMRGFGIPNAARSLGLNIRHKSYSGEAKLTLNQFREQHPTGVFLLHVRSHSLVLRDGKVVDPNAGRLKGKYRVISYEEILNPGPPKFEPAVRRRARYYAEWEKTDARARAARYRAKKKAARPGSLLVNPYGRGEYRDAYRGFIINYSPNIDGVEVLEGYRQKAVHKAAGYDGALEWIDKHRGAQDD